MRKLQKDNWVTKCIRRPYLAFEGILGESALHPLPAFTAPPHNDESQYPVPQVVFRMFDYTDAPEVRGQGVGIILLELWGGVVSLKS